MTAIPGDSVVAGRLEIPVESDTKGFKERLKKAVEKAAEGVVAQIEVDLDAKTLKKKLEAKVEKAAEGVAATIGVDVDASTLRAKLEAAAKAAGSVTVKATVEGLAAEVRKEAAKAEAASGDVKVGVKGDKGPGFLSYVAKYIGLGRALAKKNPVEVEVRTRSVGGGGKSGKGGGFEMPEWLKPRGGARSSFLPIGILGLASVIQPAIAAIVGSLGGLVAMAGSAAASLNVLGGAGGAILAAAGSMTVLQLAFGGLFGKLEKVPPRLMPIRKEFEKLRPEMEKFSKTVQNSFWDQWKNQIVSTGKVALPILREGLSGIGRELGETAKQGAEWIRSPLFKKQSGSIFYTMRTVTDGFGSALLGVAKGFVNITVAAGPMLTKFGDVLRDFGKWSSGIGDTADEQKRLGVMFDYAWKKAAQLWDMAKNVGVAIKEVFSAGRQTGDNLLGSLQSVVAEWRAWAESTKGQARIKEWFENVEPIARSAGRIIVDLGKAIARLSEDGTTAGLLEKIRTELLPSLETFLRNLGTTLGPKVIEFVTNVLEVLTQMSAAGSPLGQGLSVINGLIGGLADIFQANPALAKNVGILLGSLLAFRALSFFGNLIPGIAGLFNFVRGGGKAAWVGAAGGIALFSGALSGLPGAAQGAVAAVSTLLTVIPSLRNFQGAGRGFGDFGAHVQLLGQAFKERKGDVNGFSGALKGLSGSIGYGAGAVGGGIKGALGGLMGLLGGPWGLALTAASAAIGAFAQAQANAKADADSLNETIDKQTGKFTAASKEKVGAKLSFDVNKDDLNFLDTLGANTRGAADAVLGSEEEYQRYIGNLETIRDNNGDAAKQVNGLINAMGHQRDAALEAKSQMEGYNLVTGDTAGVTKSLAQKFRDMAPSAREVADALERLAGITLGTREANRRAAEATDALNAAIKENGRTHDDNTAKGRANNAALDAYAQAQVAAAKASAEAGASTGSLTAKLEAARAKFIASAKAAGYTDTEAQALATQMQLTGEAAKGMAAKVDSIKGKTVIVKVTDQASAVAAAAQRAIDSVTGKTVTILSVFKTQGFQASLAASQAVRNAKAYYGEADGGILQRFADGGFARAIGDRIKSFANGAERHIAQIARPGAWRVWAEPETGGEAYIPLAESKRGRSMEILAEVARRFGMALTPIATSFAASMPRGPMLAPAGAAMAPSVAVQPRQAPNVTFESGAITVNNPEREPASKSVSDTLRGVATFGLFGEEE